MRSVSMHIEKVEGIQQYQNRKAYKTRYILINEIKWNADRMYICVCTWSIMMRYDTVVRENETIFHTSFHEMDAAKWFIRDR